MSGDGWGNEHNADAGNAADTGGWVEGIGDEITEVKSAPPPLPWERRDAPIAEWEKPVNYNYEAFGKEAPRDWAGNEAVYHWDGEEGDVGPEYPELEKILFGKPEDRDPQGPDFKNITMIDVLQEGLTRIKPVNSFATAGLHPVMQKNVELCGYKAPTPIQQYCIPAIKLGHDIIAIAQTGSGKTAAYLIPILNHLMGKAKKLAAYRPDPKAIDAGISPTVTAEPLVVIVCPARELAIQIFTEARKFCYRTMLRPCVVYGGGPLKDQIAQLQKGCDILVASPGRLIDMMERPHILTLRRVKYMVIDEADEMLHSDWEEEFNKILSGGEQEEGNVKYMLFSATFPTPVRKLARTHLAESHVRIRVGRIGSSHQNIEQDIIWVDNFMKKRALLDLIYSLEPGRTIIFVNNKRVADDLDDYLFHNHMPCTSMHADRTQREREDSMRAFRNGTTPLMVTTGVSARGIDVKNIKYVINYDLPSMDHGGITEYIHRIGRTARIGHPGKAFSFYTERDEPIAEILTKTLLETKQKIPEFLQQYVPTGEELEKLKFEPDSDEESDSGGDNWGGGGDSKSAVEVDAGGWSAVGTSGPAATGNSTWGFGDASTAEASAGSGGNGWGSGGGSSW